MDNEKRHNATTTDGKVPRPGMENAGAPAPINQETGQHEAYWVLSEDERAKRFVRPLRTKYVHAGIRPKYPTRELTGEKKTRYETQGYVLREDYPESEFPIVGRFWTQAQLDSGCGTETVMGNAVAETYARDPKFYGSTFCVACKQHLPLEQFKWSGTEEIVGS